MENERFKIYMKNKDKDSFDLRIVDTVHDTYTSAIITKRLDQLQLIMLIIGLINQLTSEG